MAPFLPVRAISRSQKIRIGRGNNAEVKADTTFYVDLADGNSKRDLMHHQAIGAVVTVGVLSATSVDDVVISGGVVTNGTGLTVNVSAGEIRKRSTGAYVAGAAGTNFALTAADATQDRTDLVHWDSTSGAVGKTDGTLAAAGTSVAPAAPAGKVPLYTVLVAATVTVPGTKTDVRPRP